MKRFRCSDSGREQQTGCYQQGKTMDEGQQRGKGEVGSEQHENG